jgi:hypothetical protein
MHRNDLTLTGQSVLRVQLASTLFLKNSFHWRVILYNMHKSIMTMLEHEKESQLSIKRLFQLYS